MAEEIGLRARKKLETRQRIEAAAAALIAQHGYDATTIDSIADAANISPRTFFYYFPTKEDVVLADYAGRLDRIIDELVQRPAEEPPWEALRASFLVVAANYDTEHEQLVHRFQIMATTPSVYARSLQLQAGWEDALAAPLAQRMGCQVDDLRPRLVASAALGAMRSAQRHWVITGQHSSLPALVEACFDQLADGLGQRSLSSRAPRL